jgi:hypothetical protein
MAFMALVSCERMDWYCRCYGNRHQTGCHASPLRNFPYREVLQIHVALQTAREEGCPPSLLMVTLSNIVAETNSAAKRL